MPSRVSAVNLVRPLDSSIKSSSSSTKSPDKRAADLPEVKGPGVILEELLKRGRTLITDGKATGELTIKYGPENVSVRTEHTVGTQVLFKLLQEQAAEAAETRRNKFIAGFTSNAEDKVYVDEPPSVTVESDSLFAAIPGEDLAPPSNGKVNSDTETAAPEAEPKYDSDVSSDPLARFKETLFGEDFAEALKPDPEELRKAVESGEFTPDPSGLEALITGLSGFIKDTGANGKIEIEYSPDTVTFRTNHNLGTPNLIQALDLILQGGKGKEIKILDREAGRKLVQLMAKYGRQYMEQKGYPLTELGFKQIVKESATSGENGGIVFKGGAPGEAQRELAEWTKSLTLVDKLFLGRIFANGVCQRKSVFDEITRAITAGAQT